MKFYRFLVIGLFVLKKKQPSSLSKAGLHSQIVFNFKSPLLMTTAATGIWCWDFKLSWTSYVMSGICSHQHILFVTFFYSAFANFFYINVTFFNVLKTLFNYWTFSTSMAWRVCVCAADSECKSNSGAVCGRHRGCSVCRHNVLCLHTTSTHQTSRLSIMSKTTLQLQLPASYRTTPMLLRWCLW